jgi:hypothetical protein
MKYSVNYYLNSACKDRRPDTVEDAENDFCVEEFAARNDKAAIEKVFEIIDEEDTLNELKDEHYTLGSYIEYLSRKDVGDGSTIVLKIVNETKKEVVYNSGLEGADSLEEWIAAWKGMGYYEEIISGYSIDDEEGTRHLITTDFDKAIAFAKENGYYVFEGVLCQDGSEFKQDCDYEMIYDPAEANEEDI